MDFCLIISPQRKRKYEYILKLKHLNNWEKKTLFQQKSFEYSYQMIINYITSIYKSPFTPYLLILRNISNNFSIIYLLILS